MCGADDIRLSVLKQNRRAIGVERPQRDAFGGRHHAIQLRALAFVWAGDVDGVSRVDLMHRRQIFCA